VPVIVYEAGEGLRVDDLSVHVGMRGVLRVMAHLGMVRKLRERKRPEPVLSAGGRWVRAEESGLFRPFRNIGDHVKGRRSHRRDRRSLWRAADRHQGELRGMIIGRANIPAVNQGDALFHIARVENASEIGEHYETLERQMGAEQMLDEDEII
jgi:predicted deacylase